MSFLPLMIVYIIGIFVILYFISIRPAKRKHQQMREMHDALSIGDKITTIGGIYGTVTERDADTVKVLVDEKTGTTLKITIFAVQSVVEKAWQQK